MARATAVDGSFTTRLVVFATGFAGERPSTTSPGEAPYVSVTRLMMDGEYVELPQYLQDALEVFLVGNLSAAN